MRKKGKIVREKGLTGQIKMNYNPFIKNEQAVNIPNIPYEFTGSNWLGIRGGQALPFRFRGDGNILFVVFGVSRVYKISERKISA